MKIFRIPSILCLLMLVGLRLIAQSQISYEQLKSHGDSLLRLSGYYLNNDLDSSELIANQLLQFSIDNQFLRGESQAYGQLGHINSYRAKRGTALDFYQKSLDIHESQQNHLFIALTHENIGFLLYEDNKYEEALSHLKKSLNYFEKQHKDDRREANIQLCIALIYLKQGKDFRQIMDILDQVENQAQQEPDKYLLIEALNTKSLLHLEYEQDVPNAIVHSKRAIKTIRSWDPEDYFDLSISYSNLSRANYLLSRNQEALMYNDSAISLLKKIQGVSELLDSYAIRLDILKDQKKFDEALGVADKIFELKDVISDEQQSNQLNDLQTKYETQQKEQEILSLTQRASIQELQLQQKTLTIVVVIVVFLMIIGVSYFLYFQKTASRKRKQVELEQRFLRSQLNPHFISNALVAVQSSLMNNDVEATSSYLTTFSRLMREMLENSREEFIPIEDEIAMIRDYLALNQRRLNNAFTFEIEVNEDIDIELDSIPPMFVQPFVENAIEHGLVPGSHDGEIHVSFHKREGFVQILVKDNGIGMKEVNTSSSNKRSLSSEIIRERMTLFNQSLDQKIQLSIKDRSEKEPGTSGIVVELSVPLQA